jgi:hypothetical protein
VPSLDDVNWVGNGCGGWGVKRLAMITGGSISIFIQSYLEGGSCKEGDEKTLSANRSTR